MEPGAGGVITIRGRATLALTIVLLATLVGLPAVAEDLPLPTDPAQDDGSGAGGTSGSGGTDAGDAIDGAASASVTGGADGPAAQQASGAPQVPEVPGDGEELPPGDGPGDGGLPGLPVETLPPEPDGLPTPQGPDSPLAILVLLVVFGVVALYAPGEVRRLRIEAALRDSLDARLALARGEFAMALEGFDRAIEQAHFAYTRRVMVGRPAEWTLMPDDFYISLWRGRAQALLGMGRERAAAATMRIAEELQALLASGA